MSSRAAAKMVKQNIITTAGGTCPRVGVFCGQEWRQHWAADDGFDLSPLADNSAKGPCFHLLELTQRVGLRGEKTNKNRPFNSNARFLINGG